MGGPLLTWLPIMVHANDQAVTSTLVARSMVWYLTVIGCTRHLHDITGWDPSGHAIVYGAQLAPLWQLWATGHGDGETVGSLRTLSLLWLLSWAAVLCYLSAMTAMAFHTLSETAAAAALVLALAIWLCRHEEPRVVEGPHLAIAGLAWVLPTAWSWAASTMSAPLLLGMLLYDLVVWLCVFILLRRSGHELIRY